MFKNNLLFLAVRKRQVTVVPVSTPASAIPVKQTTGTIKEEVLFFDGHKYRKLKGRAYRSYWTCLSRPCIGQVMINELKGGSISVIEKHSVDCRPTGF